MIHVYSCIQSRLFKVYICSFKSPCSLTLLIRLTGAAYYQRKDGALLFLLALLLTRCGYRHHTAFERAYCYSKTYSRCRDVKSLYLAWSCFSVKALHLYISYPLFPCTLSSLPHLCLAVSPLGMPSFIKSPDDQTGISGGVASFVCQAVGEPKPRITWMKKGKKVSSQRFEVQLRS